MNADAAGVDRPLLAAERRLQMVLSASVIGGVLILAYCVSRVKAKREAKKSIQTLFYTK
jgi:outer membrane murein-binding lipoprotein Lpp